MGGSGGLLLPGWRGVTIKLPLPGSVSGSQEPRLLGCGTGGSELTAMPRRCCSADGVDGAPSMRGAGRARVEAPGALIDIRFADRYLIRCNAELHDAFDGFFFAFFE